MSESTKYAILDTDFVSKANIIKSNDRVLADEVLNFPDYRFYCHQKMREELGDHGTRAAQGWLNQKIVSGDIICYDDKRILTELSEVAGKHVFTYYRSFLKAGCDMYDSDFYERYFNPLDDYLQEGTQDVTGFMTVLKSCEASIGHQESYGEAKAFVLTKAISQINDTQAFVICSDDHGARQGFANVALIPCISILSVFLKLKLTGKKYEEVSEYYQGFIDWCLNRDNPQVSVRVWKFEAGTVKRIKVPVNGVLDDIYADKYVARKDGDLLTRED